MKRLTILLAVAIALLVPSTASAALLYSNSYYADVQAVYGTLSIPLAAYPWDKYEHAAVLFWQGVPPASPKTTTYGNNGAAGYAIPHWCRDSRPYFYFPAGVSFFWESNVGYFGATNYIGQPPIPGADWGTINGYCSIRLNSGILDTLRNRCLVVIHEWGHLLGWTHTTYPAGDGWIMDPSREDPIFGPVPQRASSACATYGM